jgi:hypothetical protein
MRPDAIDARYAWPDVEIEAATPATVSVASIAPALAAIAIPAAISFLNQLQG